MRELDSCELDLVSGGEGVWFGFLNLLILSETRVEYLDGGVTGYLGGGRDSGGMMYGAVCLT